MTHYVLILAAGLGLRLKSNTPKQFLEINGRSILMHNFKVFLEAKSDCKIYVALPPKKYSTWEKHLYTQVGHLPYTSYPGGVRRVDTVHFGIKKIMNENKISRKDLLIIHDAARPFITPSFVLELINFAKKKGNAVPIVSIKDSLREILTVSSQHPVSQSKNRSNYCATQTPQIYLISEISNSYNQLFDLDFAKTNSPNLGDSLFDDASVYDFFKPNNDSTLNLTDGRDYNIKITTPLDYFIAPKIYEFCKTIK